MKKIIAIIIGIYIAIMGILIMVEDRNLSDDVYMLTIIKDYARLLTQEETIDVPFYISDDSSFIVDERLISQAYLDSNNDETAIDVLDFKYAEETIIYESIQYHKYYITLSFEQTYSQGLNLHMDEAILTLVYENDTEIDLNIGTIDVLFSEINTPRHLDFKRMYSIHENEAIVGVYLELINKTNSPIEIVSIDCLNQEINADLSKFKYIYDTETHIEDIYAYMPDFESVTETFNTEGSMMLHQDMNVLIPVQHKHQLNPINRFPLIIEYIYQDDVYKTQIDDYLFYDLISDFYKELYNIETYQYHHQ